MSQYYKDAGVDIEAGYEAVARMKKHVSRTVNQGVMSGLGSFGALFDLASYKYSDPVLVSGTDGVGTKILLAQQLNDYSGIGIDCVAMCVNDILAQGARPLFFLDYLAVGKNHPEQVEQIVASVAAGCVQAGCALIGGETAEMAGLYDEDEFDLAGFAVGCGERSALMNPDQTKAGQAVIGLTSSGLHSNGFSLVRKLISTHQLDFAEQIGDKTLQQWLLEPTRIYVQTVLALLETIKVKGIAHITGGGFYENMPRCLQAGLGLRLQKNSWPMPAIYPYLQAAGQIPDQEMYSVFNMGIGLILVVETDDVAATLAALRTLGEIGYHIGEVSATAGVEFL